MNILNVQQTDSLLWVVDTAPVVLGLFAAYAGRKQDILAKINDELRIREKELVAYRQNLEERVKERTEELEIANRHNERRSAQFESISTIARTISSSHTLDVLLPQITQTISEQFNVYHVGIFLLDTNREYAILSAANSAGGKLMLARNHSVLVGGSGTVGDVTKSGQTRLALNTGRDSAFFNTPELPDSQSVIALPLRAANKVIGVLDVHSVEFNAFTDEDATILSALADEVGIAIQNARSYQLSVEALAQADAVSRQMSDQQWKRFFASQSVNGYIFDGLEAKTVQPSSSILNQSLTIPLILRGIQIGSLKLSATDPNRIWTEDEVAIIQATAERTALAVDGARLLQEAQKRAAKERAIGEISAKIGGLVNIENILQTVIQELGNTMSNTDIAIQFTAEAHKQKL